MTWQLTLQKKLAEIQRFAHLLDQEMVQLGDKFLQNYLR